MALWHGLLLMILRAVTTSCAENLQRFAQRKENPKRWLNAFGVALGVLGAPLDAVAYTVAPQSLLAPVGMVGMLFSLLAAQHVHGDDLTLRDVLSALAVLFGAGCCIHSGSSETQTPSWEMYAVYASCVLFVCTFLGLSLFLRESTQAADVLASALLGGSLASSSVVCSKTLMATLTDAGAALSQMLQAALPLGLVAPAHLYVLNRSYGRHSLVIMSPSMGASALLCNVLTGYLLYGEVPLAAIEFSIGISLICLGILSLMAFRSKKVVAVQ
ncbi:unnamed protein product [Durusdinium trenchii]|uniref:Magnesium transporter n=1 Tax=Durusdinium trenchii TaxID=1381693 RepID=A0ABP0LA05_9DINO